MKKLKFWAAAVSFIAFQSSARGFLTRTVQTPSAQTLGHGIIELGGGAGVYKPAQADTYSGSDKTAWGNFGVTDRFEGGITLYTSTMAAANVKLLLLKGGRLPSLAVGVNNITGKTKEIFSTGAPGNTAVSNSVYGVISQDLRIGRGVLTISAGKGNRGFVDKTGDFENFRGAFAGMELNAGPLALAVEEDGRDVNCSLSFNFHTGISVGANARNLKENLAPKVFGVFLNFTNSMIEQRISALEAKMQALSGERPPEKDEARQSPAKPKAGSPKDTRRENAEKTFQKAMARFNNNEFEKSIPLFEKTLSLEPENKEAGQHLQTAKIKSHFMTGHKLFAAQKYTESIKFFEKVLELSPGHSASEDYIRRAKQQIK